MKKNKKNKKGFSLIEALLSVFILATTMIVVLNLMASNLKNSLDTIDQEVAGFLAQEGAELARNIRDTNWKNGGSSFDNFPAVDSTNCRIDMNLGSGSISACGSPFEQKRLLVNNEGFYIHLPSPSAFPDTKFFRKIDVAYTMDIATGTIREYATVTSMVVWGGTTFYSINDCNTANKCAYVQVTLSSWGE